MHRHDQPPRPERIERFSIDRGGNLVRSVIPRRGEPYEHTCGEEVYKDVAWTIEQFGAATFTGEEIRERIDAPCTQVFTALAFLKERGCIIPARKRRSHAASDYVYEDALIGWYTLREGVPGSA